jgi:hypothetical protein
MVCNIRGEKSVINPHVPEIIMNSDNKEVWINWLRQTFDDEGSVRYRNNYNHEYFSLEFPTSQNSIKVP